MFQAVCEWLKDSMIGEFRLLAGPRVTFASSAAERPSAHPWCQILAGGTMASSPAPSSGRHNPPHAPNCRPSGARGPTLSNIDLLLRLKGGGKSKASTSAPQGPPRGGHPAPKKTHTELPIGGQVFVFGSVSAPPPSFPPLPPSLTHTHSHTPSLTSHSLIHSLTHSSSLTHTLTLTHPHYGLRRFCVAGVGQCPLPRGRMHALASLCSKGPLSYAKLYLGLTEVVLGFCKGNWRSI